MPKECVCYQQNECVILLCCVLQVLSPEQQRAFCRIGALIRGFLTRRLLKTEKVKHLRQTVLVSSLCDLTVPKQSDETATEPVWRPPYLYSGYAGVHPVIPVRSSEPRRLLGTRSLPAGAGQSPGEEVAIGRLQSSVCLLVSKCFCVFMPQLRAALYDIHEIFFVAPLGERLALLQQDRELRAERKLREMVGADSRYTGWVQSSPRLVLYSWCQTGEIQMPQGESDPLHRHTEISGQEEAVCGVWGCLVILNCKAIRPDVCDAPSELWTLLHSRGRPSRSQRAPQQTGRRKPQAQQFGFWVLKKTWVFFFLSESSPAKAKLHRRQANSTNRGEVFRPNHPTPNTFGLGNYLKLAGFDVVCMLTGAGTKEPPRREHGARTAWRSSIPWVKPPPEVLDSHLTHPHAANVWLCTVGLLKPRIIFTASLQFLK